MTSVIFALTTALSHTITSLVLIVS